MKLKAFVKRKLKFLYLLLLTRNLHISKQLSLKHFNRYVNTYKGGNIFFNRKHKFNIELPQNEFLLSSEKWLDDFKKILNANYSISANGEFVIAFNELNFTVTSVEDFYILSEIFINKVYNFLTVEETTVFDIGMNVGYASIYFAGCDSVENVFSFEPFERTFAQAKVNINKNPGIANKIKPFNFGLSDCEEVREMNYSFAQKGSVGLLGHVDQSQSENREIIRIKNFLDVYEDLTCNLKSRIAIKIDCEGDEYKIIPLLRNVSKKPEIIMLEWHRLGPGSLEAELLTLGYTLFSFSNEENNLGLLYGVRNNGTKA